MLPQLQRASVAVTGPDGVVGKDRDNSCPDVTLICMEGMEGKVCVQRDELKSLPTH